MLNVIDLGVKNDGSEDISTIVNEATAQGALYFPVGIYKVAKPLHLKNPVYGAGYSRRGKIDSGHTWLVSEIESTEADVGVINYAEAAAFNVENLNIICHSQECGIRMGACSQASMTYFEKLGISNVKSFGFWIEGSGSRPIFFENITIFGSRDYPIPGVGIHLNNYDNRINNVEIMGCRVCIDLCGCNSYTYGNNLHLWTGPMSGKDNGTWWRGTRGIVLENSTFSGSQIYPDTCFYSLEAKTGACAFHINNIFYWEDGSTGGSPDFDGKFFHSPDGERAIFQVCGGDIAVFQKSEKNGRNASVYTPGTGIRDVQLRTDLPLETAYMEQLFFCDALPDYTVEYREQGLCRVAQVLMGADQGYTEGVILLENGAKYRLQVVKKNGGKGVAEILPANPLATSVPFVIRPNEQEDSFTIYLKKTNETPETIRFTAESQCPRFRPVDFGILRSPCHEDRTREVLED